MDVQTPSETAVSAENVRTWAVAVGLAVALLTPGLVAPAYASAGAAVALLAGVALSTRALCSALAAFRRRQPPDGSQFERPPTVSLVLTAYNEADALPATIDACLALDYPPDRREILVCYEAASTDGTAAVAREYAAAEPRVRAIERPGPPAGKAAATNHALGAVSGEIVAVLDADQRPEPNALVRAVRWFRDDDVWCAKGRCFGTNAGASLLALCATVERGLVERTEFYARDLFGGFTLFTGGQALFRTEALGRLGPFDESLLIEDVEMAYRLQRAGGEVRVDPGVVTRETNPVGLSAWWSQRKRWARGGMQVARRHLGRNMLVGPPSLGTRVDAAATLGTVVALPFLVFAAGLVPVALLHGTGRFPLTAAALPLWLWALGVPLALPFLLFGLDRRDGRAHDRREYAAPLLLWPYAALQSLAVVTAFVEEFLLRRSAVYVTSTEADAETGADAD